MEYKLNCAQLRQMARGYMPGIGCCCPGVFILLVMRRISALWLPWTPGSRCPMICKTQ